MKTFLNVSLFCAIAIFFDSCATSYKPIYPLSISYPAGENAFSCKFDVLREAGNIKLSKKEERNHVRVVAIKLVNNTGRSIKYGDNFLFYSDDKEIKILSPGQTTSYLKQSVPSYLLYMGLAPATLKVSSANKSSVYPIGLILGTCMAAYNIETAARANKNLRIEMERNNIIGREIGDGETFIGLIAIPDNHFLPLSVKMCN